MGNKRASVPREYNSRRMESDTCPKEVEFKGRCSAMLTIRTEFRQTCSALR